MSAYYNEFDPYAAQWLRNLITAGHIAPGDVDDRSICDVRPGDLAGYTQCHFFAGIGGWSLAARLAGWSDDREMWSGSCPCQPFSRVGKQGGAEDERHLWPAWFNLIRQCRPPVVFGEQVEAAIDLGWLDLVQDDLEREDYAFAPVGVPAAGVGAPHGRHRLWFVGHSIGAGLEGRAWDEHTARGRSKQARSASPSGGLPSFWSGAEWSLCPDNKRRPHEPGVPPLAYGISARVGRVRAYGNAIVPQVAAEVIAVYMECRP